MAHSTIHADNSVKRWGGKRSDYLAIHQWLDASKAHYADVRHRALRHHTEGIAHCERAFGVTILNSENKEVPVRYIAEQHIQEDLGRIPTVQDWLSRIQLEPWMGGQRLSAICPVCNKPAKQPSPLCSAHFVNLEGSLQVEKGSFDEPL